MLRVWPVRGQVRLTVHSPHRKDASLLGETGLTTRTVRFMAVIKTTAMVCPIRIQHTVSRCTRTTRKTPDASYLIDGNIVTRLLKAGGVVVPVPHDNPHLVENNGTHQLVGALDLHHNGHDVVWGLEERNKSTIYERCGFICLFVIPNSSFWYKITPLSGHNKPKKPQAKNNMFVGVCVPLQHNVNKETWMILTYCVICCNTAWITPLITGEGRLPLFPPPLSLSLALCLTCSHYRFPDIPPYCISIPYTPATWP